MTEMILVGIGLVVWINIIFGDRHKCRVCDRPSGIQSSLYCDSHVDMMFRQPGKKLEGK